MKEKKVKHIRTRMHDCECRKSKCLLITIDSINKSLDMKIICICIS